MATDQDRLMALQGIIAEWNGHFGYVLTEDGDRIFLSEIQLRHCGFNDPPKIGDEVHFWAERHIAVSYKVKRIRVIVPQDADTATLNRYAKAHSTAVTDHCLETNGYAHDTLAGTIDRFDVKSGSGVIRTDDDELVAVKIGALPRSQVRRLKAGCSVYVRILRVGDDRFISEVLSPVYP